MAKHQPYTDDRSANGRKVASNNLRLQLWADDVFAHQWTCHPERECEDGCQAPAIASRLALYQSELES